MILATAQGPSVLWYATRGAGAVTLVLLTMSVVLGIAETRGWQPAGAPRFGVAAVHRMVSLLALAFLALHVVTTLLDPFPPISLAAAVIPFSSSYRPLWLGLGSVAFDLLVAIAVTSVVRRRLGYRAWRALHWLAYACWPVALLHGLGTGSDARTTWRLVLTLGCVGAVVVAVVGRLGGADIRPPARSLVAGASALATIAFVAWLVQGPLATGWARRAGTPATVLAAFSPRPAARVARAAPAQPDDGLGRPFSSSLHGEITSGTSASGMSVVDLRLRLGDPPARVRVRIGGQALQAGGLRMQRSAVTLGPPSRPGEYRGRIQLLQDTRMRALVGSRDGRAVLLHLDLSLDAGTVTGTAAGAPVGGGAG